MIDLFLNYIYSTINFYDYKKNDSHNKKENEQKVNIKEDLDISEIVKAIEKKFNINLIKGDSKKKVFYKTEDGSLGFIIRKSKYHNKRKRNIFSYDYFYFMHNTFVLENYPGCDKYYAIFSCKDKVLFMPYEYINKYSEFLGKTNKNEYDEYSHVTFYLNDDRLLLELTTKKDVKDVSKFIWNI